MTTPPNSSTPPPPPAAVPTLPTEFKADDRPEATVRSSFGVLTRAELEDVLGTLRDHSDTFRKETSSAVRQLALGGLAVIWIYRWIEPTATQSVRLPPGLQCPLILLLSGLGADFLYWASGAFFWGLPRRLHLRYKLSAIETRIMDLLTNVETVHGIPTPRSRVASVLILLEIAATAAGLVLLLIFLATRVAFA